MSYDEGEDTTYRRDNIRRQHVTYTIPSSSVPHGEEVLMSRQPQNKHHHPSPLSNGERDNLRDALRDQSFALSGTCLDFLFGNCRREHCRFAHCVTRQLRDFLRNKRRQKRKEEEMGERDQLPSRRREGNDGEKVMPKAGASSSLASQGRGMDGGSHFKKKEGSVMRVLAAANRPLQKVDPAAKDDSVTTSTQHQGGMSHQAQLSSSSSHWSSVVSLTSLLNPKIISTTGGVEKGVGSSSTTGGEGENNASRQQKNSSSFVVFARSRRICTHSAQFLLQTESLAYLLSSYAHQYLGSLSSGSSMQSPSSGTAAGKQPPLATLLISGSRHSGKTQFSLDLLDYLVQPFLAISQKQQKHWQQREVLCLQGGEQEEEQGSLLSDGQHPSSSMVYSTSEGLGNTNTSTTPSSNVQDTSLLDLRSSNTESLASHSQIKSYMHTIGRLCVPEFIDADGHPFLILDTPTDVDRRVMTRQKLLTILLGSCSDVLVWVVRPMDLSGVVKNVKTSSPSAFSQGGGSHSRGSRFPSQGGGGFQQHPKTTFQLLKSILQELVHYQSLPRKILIVRIVPIVSPVDVETCMAEWPSDQELRYGLMKYLSSVFIKNEGHAATTLMDIDEDIEEGGEEDEKQMMEKKKKYISTTTKMDGHIGKRREQAEAKMNDQKEIDDDDDDLLNCFPSSDFIQVISHSFCDDTHAAVKTVSREWMKVHQECILQTNDEESRKKRREFYDDDDGDDEDQWRKREEEEQGGATAKRKKIDDGNEKKKSLFAAVRHRLQTQTIEEFQEKLKRYWVEMQRDYPNEFLSIEKETFPRKFRQNK